jgi:UPF0122 protein TTE1463
MENYIYYNELYDYYSLLLTELQKEYFEMYYINNLSFSEISEIKKVSKAAVSQQISTIEKKLEEYERLLNLKKKEEQIYKILKGKVSEEILNQIENL